MPPEVAVTLPTKKYAAERNVFLNARTGEYCIRILGGRGSKARYVSLNTKDRKEAIERLHRTGVGGVVEVADDARFRSKVIEVLVNAEQMRLSDVVDEWLKDKAAKVARHSMIHPRTISSQFMQLYPPTAAIDKPTAAEINVWINSAPTLSRRRRRMTVLGDLFKFAFDRGYRRDNLGTRLAFNFSDLTFHEMERSVEPPFTQEEYEKLLACPEVKGFWRYAIQFSWWGGLRMVDCANMQWGSFCAVPGKMVCWQQKTSKRLEHDLNDPVLGGGALLKVIEEMKQEVEDAVYCFPERKNQIERERSRMVDEFRDLCIKAGLDGRKTWKCFRSAAAQRWQAAGRTIKDIGLMLGHVGTSNTAFYLETTRPR